MRAEILVNVTPQETRVALIEDDATQDLHIERSVTRSLVGNIYAGKVVRVLPGMQSAFVDIGVERNSLLHVSDIAAAGRSREPHPAPLISASLRAGDKVIVQVTKDSTGSKGARLTTELSLSTRFLVLMPQMRHLGVSQMISDAAERGRLQRLLTQVVADEGTEDSQGFILRTAAAGAGAQEIAADLRYLQRVWAVVAARAKSARAPAVLHEDLPLQLRTVRDLARPAVQRIVVDNEECFATLHEYCGNYVPEIAAKLQLYQGEQPLFERHGVEADIQNALERRVELPSGGHLIIDQAEAMTTIDVNTGSFVGRENHAQTILKTNQEAALVLARQLRLRNVGGIIIVDFIDMDSKQHRSQVHATLETALQPDPAHTRISSVSKLGLIEMTRKRTRDSLQRVLCEACPACDGRGLVKTAETVCYDIFRAIRRGARRRENATLLVVAAQAVVDRLQQHESTHLDALAERIGNTISLRAQPGYRQEQFDVMAL